MGTTTHTKWAREYETIYILQPQVDPDEADRVAGRMSEVVTRLEGRLTKVDNWGKRKLAYPIRRHTRGVFVYLRYVGFSDMVAEIERNLRMLDSVIRHQTIQLQDEVDPALVTVDPEEVKFRRLEVTPDEEEPGLEARLSMVEEPRSSMAEEPMADEVAPDAVAAEAATGDTAADAEAEPGAETTEDDADKGGAS